MPTIITFPVINTVACRTRITVCTTSRSRHRYLRCLGVVGGISKKLFNFILIYTFKKSMAKSTSVTDMAKSTSVTDMAKSIFLLYFF
jgi:hypothetical protein